MDLSKYKLNSLKKLYRNYCNNNNINCEKNIKKINLIKFIQESNIDLNQLNDDDILKIPTKNSRNNKYIDIKIMNNLKVLISCN